LDRAAVKGDTAPVMSPADTPLQVRASSARAAPPCRAIVVGASHGVGAALVRQLAREGSRVAALARSAEPLDELARAEGGGRVLPRRHDVRDVDAVPALFEELVRELGGLDLLIYSAAIMPPVGRTEYDTPRDLDVLAVNFGGLVAWGNAAAQLFRTQRAGVLVGISSIAADRGRKRNPIYGASKAAMDHWLEALRNRLAGEGVHVCTIKPGYIATRITEGLDHMFWVSSPEQAAAAVLAAARAGANVRYVMRRWRVVGTVMRLLPSFVFRRLDL
jgi:decaprenylphospho-beta-D-erythro-pentofuranosid-2-ulose 2-reductase